MSSSIVRPFPKRDSLQIVFAHAAYAFGDAFSARNTGLKHVEVRTVDDLKHAARSANVVVASGLWRNEILAEAPDLRFVQSISAGTDNFDRAMFRDHAVRLASAQGANARAVAEHAMALTLAVMRLIPSARDNQNATVWRGMIGDRSKREQVVGGKTMLVVGLGGIGSRLARLAKAFDMKVLATKRDASRGSDVADVVLSNTRLAELVPQADIIVLTCPLTTETEKLINADIIAMMKPTALLVNVARGKVVDEPALIAALQANRIAGAALDVTAVEPLPTESPLWSMPNVLLTPHSAGETRSYEEDVVDLLLENIDRLSRGETDLVNGIV